MQTSNATAIGNFQRLDRTLHWCSSTCSRTFLNQMDAWGSTLEPDGRVGQHYQDTPVRSGMAGCQRLLAACRAAGMTIAHSRSHRYGANVRDDLVGSDDKGYELHPSLQALPGEIVVDKWTFGAFASTPLEEELRARGVERILLCGVLTNVCVFATASQAVDRFFRVCLVEDACAAFDTEWHDMAIRLISEPQIKKGHNGQIGLYFGEVTQVANVEEAVGPMRLLDKEARAHESKKQNIIKTEKFPHDLERRAAMKARAVDAAKGAKLGDADIECNGDRKFPAARSDTALVLIDMQSDFLEPDGRVGQHYQDTPVRSGMAGCQRLLAACRAAGMTIAHSRSHRYGANVRDDLVGSDDKGYELHPSLQALPGEIVVDKWTFGAFASTPLEEELRARGVERILLCGVLSNVCVFATASQAVDRFFRVCLVEDACAAFDTEWHDMAIRLISEPQIKKGHTGQIGLYFGEVTQVAKVEEAVGPMRLLDSEARGHESKKQRIIKTAL
eukprot:TRINITY_DN20793_c0_g1_i2.p1 TRINITY_DN20793_c0_g1~~TRINITY_DN20793_c0_g1_i2.p1  ORF type:complete len:502 (+),score=100.66 TRINITY_DN20793_c0_g1_i2:355-1860(+)